MAPIFAGRRRAAPGEIDVKTAAYLVLALTIALTSCAAFIAEPEAAARIEAR